MGYLLKESVRSPAPGPSLFPKAEGRTGSQATGRLRVGPASAGQQPFLAETTVAGLTDGPTFGYKRRRARGRARTLLQEGPGGFPTTQTYRAGWAPSASVRLSAAHTVGSFAFHAGLHGSELSLTFSTACARVPREVLAPRSWTISTRLAPLNAAVQRVANSVFNRCRGLSVASATLLQYRPGA